MNTVFKHGPASANDIQSLLDEDLSNATIRTILRILEGKGYLTHTQTGTQYIYHPVEDKVTAAKGAFDSLVDVFFGGSTSDAVATFLDEDSHKLSPAELDTLSQLIDQAKRKAEAK